MSHAISTHKWIIDSSVSTHICLCRASFSWLYTVSASVTLPNKMHINVRYMGSIFLSTSLVLHSVIYLSEFHFILLSISALSRNLPVSIQLLTNYCTILDTYTSRMIGMAKLFNGLYFLYASAPTGANSLLTITRALVASQPSVNL